MSMLNKPLFLATALLVSSLGASVHAETMSSDVVQSGILGPSTNIPELPTDSTRETLGEVQTQASAYFSPATEKDQKDGKETVALASGALLLGGYFLQSSSDSDAGSLPVVVTSPALEPGAAVAPVPELNTMVLMLVAMAGLMGATWMRKKKEGTTMVPVRLPANRA